MMSKFMKSLCKIAIPVTLQSMLQASFSIVDQIMITDFFSGDRCGKHSCRDINCTVYWCTRNKRGMVQF